MDVNRVKKEAIKLVSESSVPFDTDSMQFGDCSPIYLATTSNVRNTLKVYRDYKKVLSVCGTGAHGYEALLHGVKKVDLFDINELQRLYFLYMKTAIMVLPYKDFIRYFTVPFDVDDYDSFDDFLANDLFKRLELYLPIDVREVFGSIFTEYSSDDILFSRLVRFDHNFSLDYLKSAASFYNESEYNMLQGILRSNPDIISTHIISLTDLPNKVHESYDLILLDNILEYYDTIPGLDSVGKVDSFIKNKMSSLLTQDGSIQVAYAYGFDTDVFCEEFHLNDDKTLLLSDEDYSNADFLFDDMFSFFSSNDFGSTRWDFVDKNLMIPLVRDMGGYQYSIFDGITVFEGKNMVLTYTRRKS